MIPVYVAASIALLPLSVSAQFLMDGASIQNPMEESDASTFIFEGGVAPIETKGASPSFILHPIAAKSYCGDGVRDAGENCDGSDLAAATCMTRGYAAGTLTCSTSCTYNESACTRALSSSSRSGGTNGEGVGGGRSHGSTSSRSTGANGMSEASSRSTSSVSVGASFESSVSSLSALTSASTLSSIAAFSIGSVNEQGMPERLMCPIDITDSLHAAAPSRVNVVVIILLVLSVFTASLSFVRSSLMTMPMLQGMRIILRNIIVRLKKSGYFVAVGLGKDPDDDEEYEEDDDE